MAGGIAVQAPGLSALDLMNLTSPISAGGATDTKAKTKAAAQNFEAVFLNSMFQDMYTGIDGEGPFGGNGATGVWRSLLTDQIARSVAKAGGVGIASHVYQSLLALQEQHS